MPASQRGTVNLYVTRFCEGRQHAPRGCNLPPFLFGDRMNVEYFKHQLHYTRALLTDDTPDSSRLIGDQVKELLNTPGPGGLYITAHEEPSCPADAPSAENVSSSSSLMLPSVAERSLVEAVHALCVQLGQNNEVLSGAMNQLMLSTHTLVQATEQMAALLAEAVSEDDEEEEALTYLDGSLR